MFLKVCLLTRECQSDLVHYVNSYSSFSVLENEDKP